jgi:hypothetical protein
MIFSESPGRDDREGPNGSVAKNHGAKKYPDSRVFRDKPGHPLGCHSKQTRPSRRGVPRPIGEPNGKALRMLYALWAFHQGSSFKEGCLLAVNLGDDADTTGAVYGQLGGAFYGEEGIPEDWRKKVSYYKLLPYARRATSIYENSKGYRHGSRLPAGRQGHGHVIF